MSQRASQSGKRLHVSGEGRPVPRCAACAIIDDLEERGRDQSAEVIHCAVDMYLHAEQARSMAYLAAAKLEAGVAERRRAVSAAKVLVSQSARFVGQQAVQLHGGIGVTDELAVSHYFKRLTMITMLFGDVDHHLAQFGGQLAA